MVKLEQQVWIGPMVALERALEPFVDHSIQALVETMRPQRQQSVRVGRSLLKFALVANGLLHKNQPLPQIDYTPLHKPFFVNLPVHFNISHSHGWIALALGPKPQGVDLEMIDLERNLRPALLKKVLLPPELGYLERIQAQYLSSKGSQEFLNACSRSTQEVSSPFSAVLEPADSVLASADSATAYYDSASTSAFDVASAESVETKYVADVAAGTGVVASATNANNIYDFADAEGKSSKLNEMAKTVESVFSAKATVPAQIKKFVGSLPSAITTNTKDAELKLDSLGLAEGACRTRALSTVQGVDSGLVLSACLRQTDLFKTLSVEAYNFFFLQWTVKECLLKLQGSSIFALERLKIDPEHSTIEISPLAPQNARSNLDTSHSHLADVPWFKHLFCYKLSSLIDKSLSQMDFWLTIGAYGDKAPQIFLFEQDCLNNSQGSDQHNSCKDDLEYKCSNPTNHNDCFEEACYEISAECYKSLFVNHTSKQDLTALEQGTAYSSEIKSSAHSKGDTKLQINDASVVSDKAELIVACSSDIHKKPVHLSGEKESESIKQNVTKKMLKMSPLKVGALEKCAPLRAANNALKARTSYLKPCVRWREVLSRADKKYQVVSFEITAARIKV